MKSTTTSKEAQMTKKLAHQIFDAWTARKHSGLYSVEQASKKTRAEFGITHDEMREAFTIAFRSAA